MRWLASIAAALCVLVCVGAQTYSPSATATPLTPAASEATARRARALTLIRQFYVTGLGACGWTNGASGHCSSADRAVPSDYVVAVESALFDSDRAGWCANGGKAIQLSIDGKPPVTAKVADRCGSGCAPNGASAYVERADGAGIDLTQGLFSHFADQARGRVPVTWCVGDNCLAPPARASALAMPS